MLKHSFIFPNQITILDRLEKEFSETLIKHLFCLLSIAKRGLLEEELLELLGTNQEKLPMAQWIPIFHSLHRFLVSRGTESSRISLASPIIRQVIEKKYFAKYPKKKLMYHNQLAQYFEKKLQNNENIYRVVEELPYHLCILDQKIRLVNCLSSWKIFEIMYTEEGKYELQKYWQITNQSQEAHHFYSREMEQKYKHLHPIQLGMCYYKLGEFLIHILQLKGALFLVTRSVKLIKQGMDSSGENKEQISKLAFSINCLGRVYDRLGNEEEALQFYTEALNLRMKSEGPISLLVSNSINNIAVIRRKQNNSSKAIELYLKALDIMKQVVGEQHAEVADILNNLGEVYQLSGQADLAYQTYKQALEMRKKVQGLSHPSTALTLMSLGSLLAQKGATTEAVACFESALEINTNVFGSNHPRVATTLVNYANVMQDTSLLSRALEIRKLTLGPTHPDTLRVEEMLLQKKILYESVSIVHRKCF